jgi:hypothetical protein
MNVRLHFIFILLCFFSFYHSQENTFQQEVNYKIHVRLDDVNHYLHAHELIQYINNSDSTLHFIYFHLWPNAYKHPHTELGKQLFSQENYVMFRLNEKDFGYIDSLNFQSNSEKLRVIPHPSWNDVVKVYLNKPLKPRDTVFISTPFRVKIPAAGISRLGHHKQSYYITQWYPKPAVFDNRGWHPMPYLDQGEFYSEFGTFDVFISLPENYIVTSTGILIEPEDEVERINNRILETIQFLDQKIITQTMDFPPSSEKFKTIHFKQFRVHDFAWFADKRFYVLHDVVNLPESGREVDTWVYFLMNDRPLWQNAIDYLNRSVLFYSGEVGEYPYNQISVVSGEVAAGGGMEYPCIAIISPVTNSMQLDVVITHEVGHNWFYGILGTNERVYAALDEGINSFYESKYVEAYYPYKSLSDYLDLGFPPFLGADKIHASKSHLYSYLFSARNNFDQPISDLSNEFSSFNYGAIVYSKTAQVFKMLENFMGEENFKLAMQFYFDKYKFMHPTPTSLVKTLQFFSGGDLRPIIDYYINSDRKTELALIKSNQNKDLSHSILVKNKFRSPTPYSISAFKNNGQLIGTVWMNPSGNYKDSVFFPPSKPDYFVLDAPGVIPELYRHNNYLKINSGIFGRQRKLSINFLTSLGNPKIIPIYYFPLIAYNHHDGPMTGILLHNQELLPKPLEWFISPLFGFGSIDISGMAGLQYNIFPSGSTRLFKISLNTKKFSLYHPELHAFYIRNSLDLYWEKKPIDYTKKIKLYADASLIHLLDKNNPLVNINSKDTNRFFVRFNIGRMNTHSWAPDYFKFTNTFNHEFLRSEIEYIKYIPLDEHFKIRTRIFGGYFFGKINQNNFRYLFCAWGRNGYRDFLYDGYFIGRYPTPDWITKQISENDGNMKVRSALGSYSKYVLALNLESPDFGKIPLRFYLNVVGTDDLTTINGNVFWDAGICFKLEKLGFSLFMPLFYSKDIKENLNLNGVGFWQTFGFSFNLENMKFRETINNVFFN